MFQELSQIPWIELETADGGKLGNYVIDLVSCDQTSPPATEGAETWLSTAYDTRRALTHLMLCN
jgi:hypothetical protein